MNRHTQMVLQAMRDIMYPRIRNIGVHDVPQTAADKAGQMQRAFIRRMRKNQRRLHWARSAGLVP